MNIYSKIEYFRKMEYTFYYIGKKDVYHCIICVSNTIIEDVSKQIILIMKDSNVIKENESLLLYTIGHKENMTYEVKFIEINDHDKCKDNPQYENNKEDIKYTYSLLKKLVNSLNEGFTYVIYFIENKFKLYLEFLDKRDIQLIKRIINGCDANFVNLMM